MIPLNYDNVDLNRAVHDVQCIHPRYPLRAQYMSAMLDSSAILDREGYACIERLQRKGVQIYATSGVYNEIKEASKHRESAKRSSHEERKKALSLVERLEKDDRILDIKTRDAPLLEFENYEILFNLSRGLTKTVLQELVLEHFSGLYKEVYLLWQQYREKRRVFYFKNIEEGILRQQDISQETSNAQGAYKRAHAIIKDIEQKLADTQNRRLSSIQIPGTLDYKEYRRIMESDGKCRIPDTTPFFAKLIRFMLHRIDEGTTEGKTRKDIEQKKLI